MAAMRLVSTLRVGKPCYAGGKPDYVRGANCCSVEKTVILKVFYPESGFLKYEILNQVQDDSFVFQDTFTSLQLCKHLIFFNSEGIRIRRAAAISDLGSRILGY
ncbi:MAG: hypothetical protein PWQ27_637 [Kosmotoga sp.]|jgi:hypothetical protein|nr:hypothetical protein [Kosmotoga sp.]